MKVERGTLDFSKIGWDFIEESFISLRFDNFLSGRRRGSHIQFFSNWILSIQMTWIYFSSVFYFRMRMRKMTHRYVIVTCSHPPLLLSSWWRYHKGSTAMACKTSISMNMDILTQTDLICSIHIHYSLASAKLDILEYPLFMVAHIFVHGDE